MFILYLLSLSYYNILENKFVKNGKDLKLSYNKLNFYHTFSALLCCMTSYFYPSKLVNNITVANTIGFFINDVLVYLKKDNNKLSDYIFIYHHIAASIYFYNYVNNPESVWLMSLFWAEVSNVPSQTVYYFIQHERIYGGENNKKIVLHAKYIQFFTYSFIRIFIGTYICLTELICCGLNIVTIFNIPILLLGYYWVFVMYKNDYHKIDFLN